MKVLDKENNEIDLKQNYDDEDAGLIPGDELPNYDSVANEEDFNDGYTIEEGDDEGSEPDDTLLSGLDSLSLGSDDEDM